MSGQTVIRQWRSPGPVASAFAASRARIQGILGPVGSGKTSAVLMKMVRLALEQAPSPRDGVRRFKFTVVRDTYRQLWKTVIPTWHQWVPQDAGEWVGGNDAPAVHTLKFKAGAAKVELIAEFIAIGENRVEDVLRGYEPTAFYLNEADLLSEEVLTIASTRLGRYPRMDDGGATWTGIICDFNAPGSPHNWVAQSFMFNKAPAWEFYRQPGGMIEQSPGLFVPNPNAENIANLRPGYYEDFANDNALKPWIVRRMACCRITPPRDGKPVFTDYSEERHVAPVELKPIPGLPLSIGTDAGRTPAAILGQKTPFGQWLILDELCAEDAGATKFGRAVNIFLPERYRDWTVPNQVTGRVPIEVWCDPASAFAGDQDERSWMQIFAAETKLTCRAAPGHNDLTLRLEAVNVPLTRSLDEGKPGLLISPRCVKLIQGFAYGYRYPKFRIAADMERVGDSPEKNEFSHPHDALQNLLLGGGEVATRTERQKARDRQPMQTRAIDEEHPQGEWSGPRGGARQLNAEE